MNFADADDFLPDHPAQQRHQGRADVNGQKTQTAANGKTNAAVKCPGRAVYGQRQCIDIRIADDTAAGIGAPVTVMGDGEKQAYVAK